MKINIISSSMGVDSSISKYLPKSSSVGNNTWIFNEVEIRLNQPDGDFDYTFILDDLPSDFKANSGKVFYASAECFGCVSYNKEVEFFAQFEKCFSCHPLYHHRDVTNNLPFQPFMIANHRGHDFFSENDKINYDTLIAAESYSKTKTMSMIASNKAFSEMHILRLEFALALKKHFKDKLDLFGSGHAPFDSKADVIMPYKYHIVLENQHTPSVITEKLYDSYLGLSVPIYFGAPNVHDYFAKESLEPINPYNFKESIRKIEQILEEDNYEKYLPHLITAKKDVLDKYCTFKRIVEICKMDNESGGVVEVDEKIIHQREHFFPKKRLILRVIKKLLPQKVINFIKSAIN